MSCACVLYVLCYLRCCGGDAMLTWGPIHSFVLPVISAQPASAVLHVVLTRITGLDFTKTRSWQHWFPINVARKVNSFSSCLGTAYWCLRSHALAFCVVHCCCPCDVFCTFFCNVYLIKCNIWLSLANFTIWNPKHNDGLTWLNFIVI